MKLKMFLKLETIYICNYLSGRVDFSEDHADVVLDGAFASDFGVFILGLKKWINGLMGWFIGDILPGRRPK